MDWWFEEPPETGVRVMGTDSNDNQHGAGQSDASSKSSGANRREYERFDWSASVRVAWIHEHPPIDPQIIHLQACNISGGGICLRTRAMVHPGQFGVVHLGSRKKDAAIVRGIIVRHCDYDPEIHEYVIGCSWMNIPAHVKTEVRPGASGHEFRVRIVDSPRHLMPGDEMSDDRKSA